MGKAWVPVLAAGVIVGLVVLTKRAKAVPGLPATEIPTVDDIMQSGSIAMLQAYYRLIGELNITGKITDTEYDTLYGAYYERWYQLVGE